MSTTGNEYEQPGVNYPDREDADGATATPPCGEPAREDEPSHDRPSASVWSTPPEGTDHHGQDAGATPLSAGEAQRTGRPRHRAGAASAGDGAERRVGIEKVTGIVAQTRADVGTEPVERIAEVLRQRSSSRASTSRQRHRGARAPGLDRRRASPEPSP